jgi:hypothetical protein
MTVLSFLIPARGIRPHSIRRYHVANMSASTNEHRGASSSSSSSVKRKRDHPGDTPPDAKAPKRASARRHILQHPTRRSIRGRTFTDLLASCPQSFQSLKSAELEMKRPTRRSPSGGSPLPSVQRAVVYTACTSPRARLRVSRHSISMVPSSSRPLSKWAGDALVAVNNTA